MTYQYANPPMEAQQAPNMVAPVADAATAPLRGANHWIASFVVAALLVAVFAGLVYVFAPQTEEQPLTINIPAVAPVPTPPALDVPSFAEFAAGGDSMALVQTDPTGAVMVGMARQDQQAVAGAPYSPADSCKLLLHSLNIDPAALANWHATPESDRASVAVSCKWEAIP